MLFDPVSSQTKIILLDLLLDKVWTTAQNMPQWCKIEKMDFFCHLQKNYLLLIQVFSPAIFCDFLQFSRYFREGNKCHDVFFFKIHFNLEGKVYNKPVYGIRGVVPPSFDLSHHQLPTQPQNQPPCSLRRDMSSFRTRERTCRTGWDTSTWVQWGSQGWHCWEIIWGSLWTKLTFIESVKEHNLSSLFAFYLMTFLSSLAAKSWLLLFFIRWLHTCRWSIAGPLETHVLLPMPALSVGTLCRRQGCMQPMLAGRPLPSVTDPGGADRVLSR